MCGGTEVLFFFLAKVFLPVSELSIHACTAFLPEMLIRYRAPHPIAT